MKIVFIRLPVMVFMFIFTCLSIPIAAQQNIVTTVSVRCIILTIEMMEKLTPEEMSEIEDFKVPLGVPLEESSLKSRRMIELRLMRNSIFAQYGFEFTIPWVRKYFLSRPWYKPGHFQVNAMKAVDLSNIKLIQNYEKGTNLGLSFDRIETLGWEDIKKLPDLRVLLNKPLDPSVLVNKTKRELRILRNSIFAQYGREFETAWLQNYFSSRSWYRPGGYAESKLTKTDKANIQFMLQLEEGGVKREEMQVIKMGYCERESDYGIERFVFKPGYILIHTIESQGPYDISTIEKKQQGEWRMNNGSVEYRFKRQSDWEILTLDTDNHTCP